MRVVLGQKSVKVVGDWGSAVVKGRDTYRKRVVNSVYLSLVYTGKRKPKRVNRTGKFPHRYDTV